MFCFIDECDVFGHHFECPVCRNDMRPPTRIFQCRNGHVLCMLCKEHPEVNTCPSCRISMRGKGDQLTTIEMGWRVIFGQISFFGCMVKTFLAVWSKFDRPVFYLFGPLDSAYWTSPNYLRSTMISLN